MDSSNNLERRLRMLLSEIQSNPRSFPSLSDLEKIMERVRMEIIFHLHNIGVSALKPYEIMVSELFEPMSAEGIASVYWYLTVKLNINEQVAMNCIKALIERRYGLSQITSADPALEALIKEYLEEVLESGGDIAILSYANELGLIYYDGEKWRLSDLGVMLLKLPPIEFAKALLSLEIFLSKRNLYCMTSEFIKKLWELFNKDDMHRIDYIAYMTKYELLEIYYWLSRLASLGIVNLSKNLSNIERGRITITAMGKNIIEQVLDPRNPYIAFFSMLIKKGTTPLSITDHIISLIESLKNEPLLAKKWNEVEQALNSFKRGDFIATFRTILPIIEHVLREIALKHNLPGTAKGLKTLAEVLRGNKWLSDKTEGFIKALGRDLDIHGVSSINPNTAYIYASLAMLTLVEVIRDYKRHIFLRKALNVVAKKISRDSEELLEAYQTNRKKLQVIFPSDSDISKARIIIDETQVFDVEEINGEIIINEYK
jgi:hypothetical protein